MTRPPVPYFGGKASVADWIVDRLPPHRHYVEPYCGGLSVLLAKHPSRMETVNDLDQELMTFWRVLRDRPDELVRACALTPHSREELERTWEPVPDGDDLELARRIWCRLAQGRSGTLRKTGWRRVEDDRAEDVFVERIAAREVVGGLPDLYRQALYALATHGTYQEAAKAEGCTYITYKRRIAVARRMALQLWHDPETPPRRTGVDRRVAAVGREQATHCAAGHEWTPENTRWGRGRSAGRYVRRCRACERDRRRDRREEIAA